MGRSVFEGTLKSSDYLIWGIEKSRYMERSNRCRKIMYLPTSFCKLPGKVLTSHLNCRPVWMGTGHNDIFFKIFQVVFFTIFVNILTVCQTGLTKTINCVNRIILFDLLTVSYKDLHIVYPYAFL